MESWNEIRGINKRKHSQKNYNYIGYNNIQVYRYKLNITTGLIIGVILDNILLGTFGLPIILLKKYGKVHKSYDIRLNKYNKYFKVLFD